MRAPFIVRVQGLVNGNPVVLHAPALAGDVAKNTVNITPLTELMTSYVLGAGPEAQIKAGTVDYTKISAANIVAAESSVKALVQPVLTAAGVTGSVDLRTTEFTANHTGLDEALDLLRLVVTPTGYELSTLYSMTPVVVDPALPPTTPLVVPAAGATAATAALAAASEFQAQLDLVSAELKGAATVAANLSGFFTVDFVHSGLNSTDFITKVLSQEDPANRGGFTLKGAKLDSVQVLRYVDAADMEVGFRVVPAVAYAPWTETLLIQKVGGKWLIKGDGHLAAVGVHALSRLKETAMSTAEMLLLSDLTHFTGTWEGQPYEYYQRAVKDALGSPILNGGLPLLENLGRIDDPSGIWGKMGVVGGGATPADRLLGQQYNHRYSRPNTQVSNYLRLEISSTRVSTLVDHAIVTGPGLPLGGLTLVPSPAGIPRPYWIYKGDSSHWEAFNSDRCPQVDQVSAGVHSVPNCGLDWTAISTGSVYTFVLKDASNGTLETLTSQLAAKPDSESNLFAQRNELFAQFNQAPAYQFEIKNIYNDVDGPFMPGRTFPLVWTNPTRPSSRLAWVGFNTQDIDYQNGNASVEDMQSVPLYGLTTSGNPPTSQSFTVNALHPVAWAWATLISSDIFGNRLDHELSAYNPY
jgi:hypothetical protein